LAICSRLSLRGGRPRRGRPARQSGGRMKCVAPGFARGYLLCLCDLRGPRAAARGPGTEARLANEVLSLRPRAAARGQRRSRISCRKARAMYGPLDQTGPGFEGKQNRLGVLRNGTRPRVECPRPGGARRSEPRPQGGVQDTQELSQARPRGTPGAHEVCPVPHQQVLGNNRSELSQRSECPRPGGARRSEPRPKGGVRDGNPIHSQRPRRNPGPPAALRLERPSAIRSSRTPEFRPAATSADVAGKD